MKNKTDTNVKGGDPGRYSTTIKNTLDTCDETGRRVTKVTNYDLNRKVGQGCEIPPDPPDPYKRQGK